MGDIIGFYKEPYSISETEWLVSRIMAYDGPALMRLPEVLTLVNLTAAECQRAGLIDAAFNLRSCVMCLAQMVEEEKCK